MGEIFSLDIAYVFLKFFFFFWGGAIDSSTCERTTLRVTMSISPILNSVQHQDFKST